LHDAAWVTHAVRIFGDDRAMRLAALVFLVACGGGGQSPTPDAPIDAPEPDAPPNLTFHRFVVDSQQVPVNNSQARTLGLDLNNDDTIDNQFGMVLGTLAGQGIDTQGTVTASVDDGSTLLLLELGTEADFTLGFGTAAMFLGDNPVPAPCASPNDTVCRRHLAGTGTFDVDASSARNQPLGGPFVSSRMVTNANDAGQLQIQLSVFGGTPVVLNLIGARIAVANTSTTAVPDGIIAGAITQDEVNTQVLPNWQASIAVVIAADCTGSPPPNCGCQQGSTGRSMIGLFDTDPQDCSVSLQEIQTNSLIQSLLAPDVRIAGQDALSLGIGFTAVAGDFTP
jgi:hypothetical protein